MRVYMGYQRALRWCQTKSLLRPPPGFEDRENRAGNHALVVQPSLIWPPTNIRIGRGSLIRARYGESAHIPRPEQPTLNPPRAHPPRGTQNPCVDKLLSKSMGRLCVREFR